MPKCELCGQTIKDHGRSYQFHKKLFKLFQIGYDHWEAPEEMVLNGKTVTKSFDNFRKDVVVRAGHYTAHYNMDGSIRFEPVSLKYSETRQKLLDQIYKDCFEVIRLDVLACGHEELHDMLVMEFDHGK